jgi:hypothetical protein
MKNCFILGTGRSGTSMVAGTLSQAGYFMGTNLIPARDGNPKGFFEDIEVNKINEALLAQILPSRPRFIGRWLFKDRPLSGQRWLSQVPLNKEIPTTPEIIERIKILVGQEPFCFKDPRFSYTLPVWRPYLNNIRYICVFRDPYSTATSIIKEVKNEPHLHHFEIDFDRALDIWLLMYRHILKHRTEGEWLFLHYEQILNGEGLEKLASFTDAFVDRTFPDITLKRSFSEKLIPQKTAAIYHELCQLAGYQQIVPV